MVRLNKPPCAHFKVKSWIIQVVPMISLTGVLWSLNLRAWVVWFFCPPFLIVKSEYGQVHTSSSFDSVKHTGWREAGWHTHTQKTKQKHPADYPWRNSQRMKTAHPTVQQHRYRRKSKTKSLKHRGKTFWYRKDESLKTKPERVLHGGVKQRAPEELHTQRHLVSYLLLSVPSQGCQGKRGGAANLHPSTTGPWRHYRLTHEVSVSLHVLFVWTACLLCGYF